MDTKGISGRLMFWKEPTDKNLTDYGWIHIQDNNKVLRTDGQKDQLIAQERGENIYKKVDSKRCEFGEQWWSKNSFAWEKVRTSWDKIYTKNQDLKMKKAKSGVELFEILSDYTTSTPQKEIDNYSY